MSNTPTNYSSQSAAHSPSHGGFPAPAEPTMAQCAARLGFDSVASMVGWLEDSLSAEVPA